MDKKSVFDLKVEINFELPYWLYLRSGVYKFRRENSIKNYFDSKEVQKYITNSDNIFIDLSEYIYDIINLDNFKWKIGFDDLKKKGEGMPHSIVLVENIKNAKFLDVELIKKIFSGKENEVYYQKLKTVITKIYQYNLEIKEGFEKSEKNIFNLFVKPIAKDFIDTINDFISIYLGFFSTENFCNQVFFLGEAFFSQDRVYFKILINNDDKTESLGFPFGMYSYPFFPEILPKEKYSDDFKNFLKNNQIPSFSRRIIGLSNHFFLHNDRRIGIILLDMALESVINRFIEYFNNNINSRRLPEISSRYTLGDFIKDHLQTILKNITGLNCDFLINIFKEKILEFHSERHLIIHRKKRHFIINKLNKQRKAVKILLDILENEMQLPRLFNDKPKQEFEFFNIATSLEYINTKEIPWGLVRLYKSFSEMLYFNQKYRKGLDKNGIVSLMNDEFFSH